MLKHLHRVIAMAGRMIPRIVRPLLAAALLVILLQPAISGNTRVVNAPAPLYFNHITRENGLPSNTVYCCIQDYQGYIWIGTSNGLARYDGHEMKIFRFIAGDSTSLQDNTVLTLMQASDSMIWIGTTTGWSLYNPATRQLKNFPLVWSNKEDLFNLNRIASFFEVKKKKVLIATRNGIIKTHQDGSFAGQIILSNSSNPNGREMYFNYVNSILPAPGVENTLLLCTNAGVITYDTVRKAIARDYKWPLEEYMMLRKMTLEPDGKLWICGWVVSMCSLDLVTGKWENYSPFRLQLSVFDFIPKNEDEFWIMTEENGLGVFNKKTHDYYFYSHDPQNPKSISSNSLCSGYYFNGHRDFWIAGTKGIDIQNPDYYSFRQTKVPYKFWWISEFFKEETDGKLFIGAYNCPGMPVLDTRNQKWILVKCDFPLPPEGLSINQIFRDSKKRLWVSTRSNLCYYDPGSNKLKLFTTPDGQPLKIPGKPVVYALCEDKTGNLWAGTRYDGVIRLDPTRQHVDYFKHAAGDAGSLIDGMHFSTILTDKMNKTWIGCRNGVSIYDPNTKRFYNGLMDTLRKYGMKKRWVDGMEMDTLGRIWLAIDEGGMVRVEPGKNGTFGVKLFNSGNGMNDETTGWIRRDDQGDLWTINGGLLRVNPYKERFRVITDQNGLHEFQGGSSKLYISHDGNIFTGDSAGFETRNIRDIPFVEKFPLNLVLESIEVNGNVFRGRISRNVPVVLDLLADQNNFVFRYTAIAFHSPGPIHYRYQLKGYDRSWINAEFSREARYTNLPPGKYEFVVNASDGTGWQSCREVPCLVIHPFFWQTWWFILLCLLSFAALFTFIYRYRVNQLLKVERMRTLIATDLHDDVSSTLSSISILSDILVHQTTDQKWNGMISEIGSNAVDMLERIDDIIWSVNPRNDKFQDLGLRIREYAIPMFESGNIAFSIDVPVLMAGYSLSMDVRRNIYLIAKESVNNLVKYSGCKNALIRFSMGHSILVMEITDDGRGFDPDKKTSRNGLRNMNLRAEKIKGLLDIRSQPGQGTSVRLEVSC
jgi:ligand-binding sensor domain-containing protein/two-component sensor histidine kinase